MLTSSKLQGDYMSLLPVTYLLRAMWHEVPRGAAKTGKTKDNMEEDGGERKGKSGMEGLERGTKRSG